MMPTNYKVVNVTPPATLVNGGAATTASVDCRGFGHCTFLVIFGATDIAATVLKVRESDDDSSYGDVNGTVFGTDYNSAGSVSALPTATDDNDIFAIDIDMRGRKRYLDLSLTIGSGSTGAYVNVLAILSRPEQGVVTAAQRGCNQVLQVPEYA